MVLIQLIMLFMMLLVAVGSLLVIALTVYYIASTPKPKDYVSKNAFKRLAHQLPKTQKRYWRIAHVAGIVVLVIFLLGYHIPGSDKHPDWPELDSYENSSIAIEPVKDSMKIEYVFNLVKDGKLVKFLIAEKEDEHDTLYVLNSHRKVLFKKEVSGLYYSYPDVANNRLILYGDAMDGTRFPADEFRLDYEHPGSGDKTYQTLRLPSLSTSTVKVSWQDANKHFDTYSNILWPFLEPYHFNIPVFGMYDKPANIAYLGSQVIYNDFKYPDLLPNFSGGSGFAGPFRE